MKEKLQIYALLAEVVSAIAIVISLFFVMLQIQENTEVIQASSRQSLASRIEERAVSVATNPQLVEVLVKATQGDHLTEIESTQLYYFLSSLLTSAEEAYLQYIDGNLSEEYLESRVNRVLFAFQTNAGKEYFEGEYVQVSYSENFLAWMKSKIVNSESN